MKVEIFDPPMCCSTGVCGPMVDPVLVRMSEAVQTLNRQGVSVERFNLAQQLKEFMANKEVAGLLQRNGKDILPVTIVNGEVLKTGEYASYEELCRALRIEPQEAEKSIPITFGESKQ
jgi:hypothetical protein